MNIQTGDTVFHKPTGEELLVAYEKDGRLAWCGWPEGEARTEDCTLVERGTYDERQKLLKDMAAMRGSDSRKRYAERVLQEQRNREDATLFDLTNTVG